MSKKPKPPQSVEQLLKASGASEDLKTAMLSHPAPKPLALPKQLPPGTAEVVNALFQELQAIFPAWKQAWPNNKALNAAKRSWTKAFMAEGIHRIEQIRFGVERCRGLGTDFAPSVGRFIKLCLPTPEMLGIPPHDVAFREALVNAHPSRFGGRTWSHLAIRHAALQCEMHNLGDLTPESAVLVFSRAYDITIRMLVEGRPLEDIAIGIGHDSQKSEAQRSEEYTEARLAATMRRQSIPSTGAAARAQLLARFSSKKTEVLNA